MKPHHLPEKCPTCSAPIREYSWTGQHAHGSHMESARYSCVGFFGASMSTSGGSPKPYFVNSCPHSDESKASRVRERQIDEAVAAALNGVKATHQECEAFYRRMDSDTHSFNGVRGIWQLLPSKEKA